MHENYAARPHPEYVVLDIGEDLGALIVYTDAAWHGTEIEISPIGEDSKRSHKDVLERGVPPAPRSPPSSTPSPRAPTRCGAAGCPWHEMSRSPAASWPSSTARGGRWLRPASRWWDRVSSSAG